MSNQAFESAFTESERRLFGTKLGILSFRMCLRHSEEPKYFQSLLADNENKELNALLIDRCEQVDEDEENFWFAPLAEIELCCYFTLDYFHGADRSLFRQSVTRSELLACLSPNQNLIKERFTKVIAVRPPFSAEQITEEKVPEEALAWRRYINNLCAVYTASFLCTSFDDNQWADVVSLNDFLLEKVGFHRRGQKKSMTLPMSYRNHKEESSFAHIDHLAFCPDYLLGYVQEGSYRLAFLLNPHEVLMGETPEWDWVCLREGEIYCITGPQLKLPHLPIAPKGMNDLKRNVLLIGGLFVYDSDAKIGRIISARHEDLLKMKMFYHFRIDGLDSDAVSKGLKENKDYLFNNRMLKLKDAVPENAIRGIDVARVIDKLEVNSSTTTTNY